MTPADGPGPAAPTPPEPTPGGPLEPISVGPGEVEVEDAGERAALTEAIEEPAKVMRIGTMVKQLLDEVRQAPLDEASRTRLREIYEQSVRELASGLSPDLAAELDRMALPFDEGVPSEAELRIAQAQLVGWLEGLFHGIQAALMAQQMAARAQLQEMRGRGLPPGSPEVAERPGTYL
ncbi:MAG TPA: proteasome activator [Acidimicrobiales bacterium]|nr:proteasome activator [Acidimicrobiales bacterium]